MESVYSDMAVACLTLGSLAPPIDELPAAVFDSMVEPIARVLEMHMEADFDSYLQAHRAHLSWAESERARDVEGLKVLLSRDFGVLRDNVPDSWTCALRVFWSHLYAEPVLRSVNPASCRIDYHVLHFDADSRPSALVEFEHRFERRRSAFRIRINNEMALPHRRTPTSLAIDGSRLAWFDLQIDATLGRVEQLESELLLRFVWDDVDQAWFLERAVTIYPDHFDLGSSRCVLLF